MAYLEPVIGAVAAFLLGFLWYTALFGKVWQAETGITDEDAQSGVAMTHGLAFLMMVVISFGLNFFFNFHPDASDHNFLHGAFHALMNCSFFCLPAIAINYLYQKKSLKLYAIDAGFTLAWCALSGGIMAWLSF